MNEWTSECGRVHIRNEDCMAYMATLPDKAFELAVVDPPYGINRSGQQETFTKNPRHKRKLYDQKAWDNTRPDVEYWRELFRVSANQIVWGANYFTDYLSPSMGWVFWDKGQDLSMSDGELAFTSFNRALRRVMVNRSELMRDGAIHPTQKPVKLYRWLLHNYAKPGDRILDTHGGSMSSVIAAWDKGFEITCCELDPDYYKAGLERVQREMAQGRLAL